MQAVLLYSLELSLDFLLLSFPTGWRSASVKDLDSMLCSCSSDDLRIVSMATIPFGKVIVCGRKRESTAVSARMSAQGNRAMSESGAINLVFRSNYFFRDSLSFLA
jgi:hypothetical protein